MLRPTVYLPPHLARQLPPLPRDRVDAPTLPRLPVPARQEPAPAR